MAKIIIIGGGAAGMFASVFLAEKGHQVHVFEKNEKLGKKLFITGKGRCNVTNDCDPETFFESVVSNPKFLYSAYYGYTSQDVTAFFSSLGVKLKTERGNRVFPLSDHSSDIIRALEARMREAGVKVHLHAEAAGLLLKDGCAVGIRLSDGAEILRLGDRGMRRIFLSGHRLHRGRLPLCRRGRAYGYGTVSRSGTSGGQGGLCRPDAGAGA